MNQSMYAMLYDRHGEELARLTLADTDSLEPEHYAPRFADLMGIDELAPSTPAAQIPDGCEDFRIEITADPSTVIVWKSCNFAAIFK